MINKVKLLVLLLMLATHSSQALFLYHKYKFLLDTYEKLARNAGFSYATNENGKMNTLCSAN
jgi:hypothetical protein